jgi:hypothetical protein
MSSLEGLRPRFLCVTTFSMLHTEDVVVAWGRGQEFTVYLCMYMIAPIAH